MSSRRSQPYRRGTPRMPGLALQAMRRGRTSAGFNPKDLERNVQRLIRAGQQRGRKRPERPARPTRPERPTR